VVEDSIIEAAVLTGEPSCAYVIQLGSTANHQMWLVNCSDGAVLGFTTKGGQFVASIFDRGITKAFFIDAGKMCSPPPPKK